MPATTGDDFLDGTSGGDTIDALAGNDTVNSLEGNDSLDGNTGDDVLNGGDDSDTLNGGDGGDNLSGGFGNDSLDGGAGSDIVNGGAGDDTMTGGAGFDAFQNEAIAGGSAFDRITDFEAGDEVVIGVGLFVSSEPAYYTSFIGTAAFSNVAGQVRYFTGGGVTTIETDYDGDGLADYTTEIQNGEFTLVLTDAIGLRLEIDSAYGGAPTGGDDTIGGGGGSDLIDGGAGIDILDGRAGNDTLNGGTEADVLDGGAGDDVLNGGDGDDSILDARGADTIDGGDGFDNFSANFAGQVEIVISDTQIANVTSGETKSISNIEVISMSQRLSGNFNDIFNAAAATITVQLFGGAGNDVLAGGSAADILEGDSGNDTVTGGLGADLFDFDFLEEVDPIGDFVTDFEPGDIVDLRGFTFAPPFGSGLALSWLGTGAFTGAAGQLRYEVAGGQTVIQLDSTGDGVADHLITLTNGAFTLSFNAANSRITVAAGAATAGNDSLVGTNGDDTIDGLDGDDTILGLGGNDSLVGGAGVNSLLGGEGDDTLAGGGDGNVADGGDGDDVLIGGASADELDGNAGDDRIDGGGGADQLTGQAGYDAFTFNLVDNSLGDEIVDFGAGDSIELGLTGQTSKDPGADLLTFIGTSAFTNTAGEVRYSLGGGQTLIEIDIDGDGSSDQSVTIANGEFDLRTTINNGPTLIVADAYSRSVDGNSTVFGSQGGDSIDGGAGGDFLNGMAGNDVVNAGDGDDSIQENTGNDTVDGGDGIDAITYFVGGPANVIVTDTTWQNLTTGEFDTFSNVESHFTTNRLAPASDDTMNGSAATIQLSFHGGAGDDLLTGGQNIDILEGDVGSDTVAGGGGDDIFDFDYIDEIDNDVVTDFAAGDRLDFNGIRSLFLLGDLEGVNLSFLGMGAFTNVAGQYRYEWIGDTTVVQFDVDGDGAADRQVTISNNNFTLVETSPNSARLIAVLSATPTQAADSLAGTAGADTIDGLAGGDVIDGGDGNDSLIGNVGNDTLNGGADNDTLVGGAGADQFNGGGGIDTVDYSATSGVWALLSGGQPFFGEAVGDTYSSVENLIGSAFDDTLDGDGGANTLTGGDGNDRLKGAGGADLLIGGNGSDVLVGGAGLDTLDGGASIDVVDYSGASGPISVNLSTGAMISGGTLNASGFYSGGVVEDTLISIENITGGASGDRLVASSAGSLIAGNGGGDRISGLGGVDNFLGGDGNDTLEGGANSDTLQGGDGNDVINGGTGLDTVDYTDKSGGVNVNVINGVALTGGFVNSAGFYQGGVQEDSITGLENIRGSEFADRLIAGSTSARIDGFGGDDFLFTFAGNDTVLGGDGNDRISTGQSTDRLFGDGGNDTLNGGTGFDTLDGGADSDTADYSDRTGGVSVNLLSGTGRTGGTLNASGLYSGGFTEDALVSIENAFGSNFGDRLVASNLGSRLEGRGGNDNISGLNGSDTIIGGAGNDTLSGGSGNDTFEFATGFGADRIIDFVEGAGVADVIRLVGWGAPFDTFAEVIGAATQVGGDVVFNFGGGNTITVVSATIAGFVADDFTFG